MKENMNLWDSVCETNPEETKHVNQRGGFTAIDAYSQIKRATEEWGPYGTWGLTEIEHIFIHEHPMVLVKSRFKFPGGEFPVTSSIKLINSKGVDDDFAKKVETDLITKALSRLGFNADVFMGKYDDNRYVQEMRQKFAQVSPEPINQIRVDSAVKFFKETIDIDVIEDNHDKIKRADKKLTNDERIAVQEKLMDKSPGCNKMYKTLLKEYLDYKPEIQEMKDALGEDNGR